MPKAGYKALLLIGNNDAGAEWKLSASVGNKIILLYFYPKDFTGCCAKQACSLRDNMGDLSEENVEVVGVSFDSVDSHKKFAPNTI